MKRRFPAQSPMRRVAASVVAVSALTLTSACAAFNPVQTNVAYEAADGVSADIGQLALRNLLLVSSGSGPAVLSGSVRNAGSEQVTVQLSPQAAAAPSGGAEVEVGPHEQLNLATEGLQFDGLQSKPGSVVAVSVTSSEGGTTILRVPVLAAKGPYATMTPAAPAPTTATTTTETTPPAGTTESATPTATPTTTATTTG